MTELALKHVAPGAVDGKQTDSDTESDVVVQRRFTWSRIRRLAEFCAGVQFVVILFFAVFGNTFISMRPFVREPGSSFLLFPGVNRTLVIDVLYISAHFALLYWLPAICAVKRLEAHKNRFLAVWSDSPCIARCFLTFFLVFCMQLLGNLHYQFYYYVGALPEENHFAMYDIRSFGASFAAADLVALALLLLSAIVYAFWYILTGRLCFDTVTIKKSPSDVEKGSVETVYEAIRSED